MPCEVVIKLKNSDKSTTYKYLEYEVITTREDDPITTALKKEAYKNFNDEVDKESVTIKLISDK